jgi:pilus assembly protein TadC
MTGPVLAASLLAAASGAAAAVAVAGERPAAALAHASARRGRWAERIAVGVRDRTRARLGSAIAEAAVAWSVEEVVATRRMALAALASVAFALPPAAPLAVALGFVAIRGPEIALARLARRRHARGRGELPLFLDLLSVAVGAGLAPQLAVRRATEPLSGPLGDELRVAIRNTDLGRRWREELSAAADRAGVEELRRAVDLVLRTERLGSSLADEMRRLAADVRESRRARASERARSAPVKMLFPLVFLILPAFLLLTVVPVLLTTVRSIG